MSTTTIEAPQSVPILPHAARPCLKLVGLHLRGLKSIRALDLPADGLGWQGTVPDLLLVGGINGCGKTILLRFIADALETLQSPPAPRGALIPRIPEGLAAAEAWIEFEIQTRDIETTRLRFLVGSTTFVSAHTLPNWWGLHTIDKGQTRFDLQGPELTRLVAQLADSFASSPLPSVVYFPSEDRTLVIPAERYKMPGKIEEPNRFVRHWRPATEWQDSLEALLYTLRWADLNAKEEGRPEEAIHFAPYAAAFRQFTDGAKELLWKNGALVLHITKTGETHGLNELSSGEKQGLLLTGELLRHWRPGSLILIDEPELHLHMRWQHALYDALTLWQRERGGQVILATHSLEFIHRAGFGSGVLLGKDSL